MSADDEFRLAINLLRETVHTLEVATERLGLVMQTLARLGPAVNQTQNPRSDFDYTTGTLPKT